MKKMLMLIAALAAFSSAAPLHAASRTYVGLQIGPEFVTDSDTDLDTAVAFGVYGGYRVDRLLSLEASLTTAEHDFDAPGGSDLEVTSILFGPRINGRTTGGLTVYAGAGLGVHFLDYDRRPGDDTETESGIYMGAGMEVPLQRLMSLGVDFKYHVLFNDDDFDSDLVTILVRLGFDL